MILIIEGMDRCYKDNLIKYIRKNILTHPKVTMAHCSSTPNSQDKEQWPVDHYTELLYECVNLSNKGWDIILNRSHLGEDVYGRIFRESPANWVYDLDNQICKATSVSMITIVDSPQALSKRDDGDSLYVNTHQIETIRDEFLRVFKQSNISHKYLHDHSVYNKEDQIPKLIELTEKVISNAKD